MSSVPLIDVLAAALLLSGTSLASRFVVWLPSRRLDGWLPWLQAAAVGLLVGDGLLHVLPHALDSVASPDTVMLAAAAGATSLVVVETVVRWLAVKITAVAPSVRLILGGDFIHHLIDGFIVGGAFHAGHASGYLALIAIAIHEVPREMSSAGVLVAGGYDPRKAFALSVAMAAAVPMGVMLTYLTVATVTFTALTSAFAAGTILYVALADILPSLWERARDNARLSPIVGITAGLLFMIALAHGERH